MAIGAVMVAGEAVALKLRSGRLAGRVVARCRSGHLFTTIWIPGLSFKAARLAWWRFQWCPVGRHWTVVTPVHEDELSDEQLALARQNRDVNIP